MSDEIIKIPARILNRNKKVRRDFVSGASVGDIAEKHELDVDEVKYIVRTHDGGDLTPDGEYEKAVRINRLKQLWKKTENKLNDNRDEVDIIKELRAELESGKRDSSLTINNTLNVTLTKEQEEYVLDKLKRRGIASIN